MSTNQIHKIKNERGNDLKIQRKWKETLRYDFVQFKSIKFEKVDDFLGKCKIL